MAALLLCPHMMGKQKKEGKRQRKREDSANMLLSMHWRVNCVNPEFSVMNSFLFKNSQIRDIEGVR